MSSTPIVYVATKMTGCNKDELVRRATYISTEFAKRGIRVISPVLEEKVEAVPVKLVNRDREQLREFWRRDKEIIRYHAHVVLLDRGDQKSFGMEREYCLSRGVLWKPTVLLVPEGIALSVAPFEDDAIFTSVATAADYIVETWGTRWKRIKWRANMLNRSLPRWLWDQCRQWR